MVSEGDRPRSSWQSWVRSSERRRPPASEGHVSAWPEADAATASPEPGAAKPAGAAPTMAADSDDDLEISLDWGAGERDAPVELGKRQTSTADANDDSDFDALEPDGFADHHDDIDQDEDEDGDRDDDDTDDDEREADDLDGELLPAVPLLPSIAGRVDALSGLLRSITMRIDGLSGASDVYRSTITDRIDEYTETILALSRQSDQTLDGFRRASERATAELRREASERTEAISQLLARVEELSTDVATLVDATTRSTDDGALRAELASLREMVSAPVADTAVLEELAALREVMSARDVVSVATEQPSLDLEPVLDEVRDLVEAHAGRQEGTERALAELRREASERTEAISQLLARVEELSTDVATLVDATTSPIDDGALRAELASLREMVSAPVADTAVLEELAALREAMSVRDVVPAAAEQPAVDLEPVLDEVRNLVEAQADRQEATERALAELRTLVEVIVDTMPASAEGSGVNLAESIESLHGEVQDLKGRLPTKGARALLTRADLDVVVEAIAEAVVGRIDVDGIVDAMVVKMESAFEVVEPDAVAPPPPPPPPPPPARRRRKG